MFICHLTGSIEPSSGGPAYSIPRLCTGLRELGHRIELLTLKGEEEHLVKAAHRPFPIFGPKKLGHAPGMWRWLCEAASQERPTLLHSHNLWVMPSIFPALGGRKWGTPHIVSPHGTLSKFSMRSGSRIKLVHWPLVQLPVLRRAAGFHATATSELEDIRRFGLRQPVAVIPNGIDVAEDTSPIPDHDARVVLYLGRIHPEKGLLSLIDAWSRVQPTHPGWRLAIVGPDVVGHKVELQKAVRDRRIRGVEFADAQFGSREKLALYRNASFCVLPSPSENFGNTVAEALCAGTPAIANRGAPWEGLVLHRCGWWIEPGIHSLAQALLNAMECPAEELRAMGNRGRNWMRTSFAWSHVAQQMDEYYGYLLGRSPCPTFVDVD